MLRITSAEQEGGRHHYHRRARGAERRRQGRHHAAAARRVRPRRLRGLDRHGRARQGHVHPRRDAHVQAHEAHAGRHGLLPQEGLRLCPLRVKRASSPELSGRLHSRVFSLRDVGAELLGEWKAPFGRTHSLHATRITTRVPARAHGVQPSCCGGARRCVTARWRTSIASTATRSTTATRNARP